MAGTKKLLEESIQKISNLVDCSYQQYPDGEASEPGCPAEVTVEAVYLKTVLDELKRLQN